MRRVTTPSSVVKSSPTGGSRLWAVISRATSTPARRSARPISVTVMPGSTSIPSDDRSSSQRGPTSRSLASPPRLWSTYTPTVWGAVGWSTSSRRLTPSPWTWPTS